MAQSQLFVARTTGGAWAVCCSADCAADLITARVFEVSSENFHMVNANPSRDLMACVVCVTCGDRIGPPPTACRFHEECPNFDFYRSLIAIQFAHFWARRTGVTVISDSDWESAQLLALKNPGVKGAEIADMILERQEPYDPDDLF